MKIRAVLLSAALAILASLTAVVPASASPTNTYYVTFNVSCLSGTGTKNAVTLTMFGPNGHSGPIRNDRDFRCGAPNKFGPYTYADLGRVEVISLTTRRVAVEYVDVFDTNTETTMTCPVHDWFPDPIGPRFYTCHKR